MSRKIRSLAEALVDRWTPDPATGCWVWNGKPNKQGYGQTKVGGRNGSVILAHLAVWRHLVGPVPDGLVLDHLCRRPLCVNPEHLEPVTDRVNVVVRGTGVTAQNARKTHCPKHHPYDEQNTRVRVDAKGRTSRSCRTCDNRSRAA